MIPRRAVLAGGAMLGLARPVQAAAPFGLDGVLRQGGWMIVRTRPHGRLRVDGALELRAGASGAAVIGFDRDAAAETFVEVEARRGWRGTSLPVAPETYDVQRIDGLPSDQVEPSDPALLARIAAQVKRKQAALGSTDPSEAFDTRWRPPLPGAVRTSRFGPQRILNGVAKTPHYGVDLAAPRGTAIQAPAGGLVVLAEPDMHFEGGLTLIDHGQGLVSMYLHQSRIDVPVGRRVRAGEPIGAVGATGRATGPHLCWRMTWRGRHMNPALWCTTSRADHVSPGAGVSYL